MIRCAIRRLMGGGTTPYHSVRRSLMEQGYTNVADRISKLSSNSYEHTRGHTHIDDYYLLDGQLVPFKSSWCGRRYPSIVNKFFTRKTSLCGEYLIILPCNPYAKIGDYFQSQLWKMIGLQFPERLTTVDFAAVDCLSLIAGGGLVVFETEMDRVRGLDHYPIYDPILVKRLTPLWEQSLPRLEHYTHILIYFNVRLYLEVVCRYLLPNMTVVDIDPQVGNFRRGVYTLREQLFGGR